MKGGRQEEKLSPYGIGFFFVRLNCFGFDIQANTFRHPDDLLWFVRAAIDTCAVVLSCGGQPHDSPQDIASQCRNQAARRCF